MTDYGLEGDAPAFREKITVPETTDTNHADNINSAPKQLLENDLWLRGQLGRPGDYDPESPYSVGDVCSHGGRAYKCVSGIAEGEEWTPGHWEEITVLGEVERILGGTDALVKGLLPQDAPVYGMIIHESDMDPESRVEYVGANRDFAPMTMDMESHAMDWGGWTAFRWLDGVVPVMAGWDGGIDYLLDPDDYTKKADGSTPSDVTNGDYAGNAMVVIPKIYKKEWKTGSDRHVLFCERRVDDGFLPVGFSVGGAERDYMLIPMFYGSIDSEGRMRSIAGTEEAKAWSCGTASGSATDVDGVTKPEGIANGVTADIQKAAILASSKHGLFFGGALLNTLSDICAMLAKSTDSQSAFGSGMSAAYAANAKEGEKAKYGTKPNLVVDGGMFYGSSDGKSYNKIFHSCVLGSWMLWQRDPYVKREKGRLKVSPEYSLQDADYVDSGYDFKPTGGGDPHYPSSTNLVAGYGALPSTDGTGTTATGYCDGVWTDDNVGAVSLRLGACNNGPGCGLWARVLTGAGSYAWWNGGASLLLPAPAAPQGAE